jgi:hypothetical protein
MHRIVRLDGWTSPVIAAVTHTTFASDGETLMQPDGFWDFAIMKSEGRTLVLRTGLTTRAVSHPHREGDEILTIAFKPSSFMPLMPGERMRDDAIVLDTIGPDRFWLGTDVVEIPTLETVDGFVARLLADETVADNALVASVVEGRPKAMSERTLQRHFLKTTGLTYKAFTQVERAQKAMAMLQQGRPAADVAFALGYADQPHLIRSLKAIMGQTPGQVAPR